ncbi:TolC family protein [Pseudomonas synxantha]|uniref:TolC family protein n=1 Tax=Pseudomonas synxantha TaxID=47883 RepID=UPI0039FD348E
MQSKIFNGNERGRDRGVGLQLSIPIFEGFGRTCQIRNAQTLVEAIQAQLAEVENRSRVRLAANLGRLGFWTLK